MMLRKLHGKFRDPLIAEKGFSGRMDGQERFGGIWENLRKFGSVC